MKLFICFACLLLLAVCGVIVYTGLGYAGVLTELGLDYSGSFALQANPLLGYALVAVGVLGALTIVLNIGSVLEFMDVLHKRSSHDDDELAEGDRD